MVLKLYVDHMSQPSRALMLFVRATKIPTQEVVISIQKGEHQTAEYTKVNKFQKVPAIVHDNFRLAESVAIFRYLATKFPIASHWYPTDIQSRARVDEFMSWQHLGLRLPLIRYLLICLLPGKLSALPPTPELIAEHKKVMEDAFDNFVNLWLDDSKSFIHGDKISIADLLAIGEIEMMRLVKYNPREGRPELARYLDRVKVALGSDYDEVHEALYKAEDLFGHKMK